ncbi:MAG TPA: hypothetical protein VF158_05500 [Longimicrobiales bacterium]
MNTGRDHAAQAAMDAAAREVARLLEPHIADSVRNGVAARIVARLHDLGWRHIPRPEPITRPVRAVPPNEDFKRARARLEGAHNAP